VGFGIIVLMALIIRYNRSVADFMMWFSTTERARHQLIREDRPEKLEQLREARALNVQMARVVLVLWASSVIVLMVLLLVGVLPD
jgi:hypothetical protein